MGVVTSCNLDCPDVCSLVIETDDQGGLKVRGNPNHPATAGFCCAKIKNYPRRLVSPDRITEPLLRTGQGWRTIDWNQALDLATEKIQALRSEPEKMFHLWSAGDHGLMVRTVDGFFGALGASTWTGSLCDEAGIHACLADFGSLEHSELAEMGKARRIVNWGKDPVRSSVHMAVLINQARQNGAKVITISPGGDSTARFSGHFIRVNPGTDRFLAAAVIKRLVGQGVADEQALSHTANWPAFQSVLADWSLTDLLDQCSVSEDDLNRLVEVYAGPEPVLSLIGWGLQRYAQGGENMRFLNALALISGNIGRSGGGNYFGISSGRSYNLNWLNAQIKSGRREFVVGRLADELAQAQPAVELIWINASNVVTQAPDSWAVAREIEKIPFKVVVEAFMTDTAALADLILPCALMWEKEDLAASCSHTYLNHAAQAAEPRGQARTEHWILTELNRRLDNPFDLPSYEDCLRLTLESPYLDTSLEELREQGYAKTKWPPIAYEGLKFAHPDGLYRFPENLTEPPTPPTDYPLRLLSFVNKNSLHSQILPDDQPGPPPVWLGKDCPAWQGRQPGDTVWLASPLARVKVRLEMSPDLHPGSVIFRRGGWLAKGSGPNQLIANKLTDLGQTAAYYEQHVRIEDE